MRTPRLAPIPDRLVADGATGAPYLPAIRVAELRPGAMRRVTFGDLDVLLAHTSVGIVATEDRCPHMSAPLSIGDLDGCIVDCPLHRGRFDLSTGTVTQMPTTGGLDADGTYHRTWSPHGGPPRDDPPGRKSDARRLTRVRRMRYFPVRLAGEIIEVAVPASAAAT